MASKLRRGVSLHGSSTLVAPETLEEICLLSAAPLQSGVDYEAWRSGTFSIDSQVEVGFSTDTQLVASATGGVSANSTAGNLIGSGLVQQTYGYTGAGYTIAVLDTGIDYTHPGLASSYVGGWDFVDDDADPMDLNGHGTHVSGIITADHATYGGIAPDVNIIGLRVLNVSGSGSFGDVEDALKWVVANQEQYNIVAVNMSLGAGNFSFNPYYFMEDELAALESKGVFIAASSGNSFYSEGSVQGLGYPAISSNTVSVGAVWTGNFGSVSWGSGGRDYTTAADRVTSFTQRNSSLDILAPGAFIQSTYLGNTYASMAGTSMAAPVAAASAALIHQALDAAGQGHLANQDYILNLMKTTGVTVVDGDDENDNVTNTGLSFKRIDLMAAISSIAVAPSQFDQAAAEAFVGQLYHDVLQRPADSGGLNAWTGMMATGSTRASIVEALWNSAEHRALQINEYYNTFLERAPASGELNAWVGLMQAGVEESLVMRVFASSGEFSQLHSSNVDFVNALYDKVLGRSASAGEQQYWADSLAGGTNRFNLVQGFFDSTERLLNDVDAAYQSVLNRAADASGRQFWLNDLRSHATTLGAMSKAMLSSDEYFSVAQAAGSVGAGLGAVAASSLSTASVGDSRVSELWLAPSQVEALFDNNRETPEVSSRSNLQSLPLSSVAALTEGSAEKLQLADQVYTDTDDEEPWTPLSEDELIPVYSETEDYSAVDDIYGVSDLADLDDDGLSS